MIFSGWQCSDSGYWGVVERAVPWQVAEQIKGGQEGAGGSHSMWLYPPPPTDRQELAKQCKQSSPELLNQFCHLLAPWKWGRQTTCVEKQNRQTAFTVVCQNTVLLVCNKKSDFHGWVFFKRKGLLGHCWQEKEDRSGGMASTPLASVLELARVFTQHVSCSEIIYRHISCRQKGLGAAEAQRRPALG